MVPRLFRSQERDIRGTFVAQLQNLVQQVRAQAREIELVHKVVFDILKHEVFVERAEKKGFLKNIATEKFVRQDQQIFLPEALVVKSLFVDGQSEVDSRTTQSWFFVDQDGNVQAVTLRLGSDADETESIYELNPFSGQFEQKEDV